jgi:quinol monooxygenase YgiN
VSVLAVVTAMPGAEEHVAAVLLEIAGRTRSDDGNLGTELHRDRATPERFVLLEHWRDDAALEAHLSRPYLEEIVELAAHALAEPPTVWYLEPAAVGRSRHRRLA